jgi:uncharacterized protein YjbI with pentapeptide repeats
MAAASPDRAELRADCARCFGLCCAALAFARSADFAIDKPAGQPCPHLQPDYRCEIHPRLRQSGFAGCTTYDCFGAGQQLSQHTFGGQSWRQAPEIARLMFAVFPHMRQLHQLLWCLAEALAFPEAHPLYPDLHRAYEDVQRLTHEPPADLLARDLDADCRGPGALLRRASELVRSTVRTMPADRSGADLVGVNLRRADLRAASLRGASLIGANVRGADLRQADLLGADLRAADLREANLAGALFLHQSQLDAARGNAATRLSPALTRPAHWHR